MKKIVVILGIFILTSSFNCLDTFKVKQVFALIDKYPFKHKDIVKKQFLLEAAHATSPVFKQNKNGFGMRLAKQRRTNALGSRSGYAVYRNIQSSVLDRYLYDMRYLSKLTRVEYLRYLNKTYSDGSGKYVEVLSKINLKSYE